MFSHQLKNAAGVKTQAAVVLASQHLITRYESLQAMSVTLDKVPFSSRKDFVGNFLRKA